MQASQPVLAVETPFKRFARHFFSSKIATVGFIALLLIVLAALLAPLISPQNPYDLSRLDVMDSRLEPGKTSVDGRLAWRARCVALLGR